jgi:hypothetical protein
VEPVSGAWRNEWLVENRLSVGASLRDAVTGAEPAWPQTHVTFVVRRPR